MRTRRHTVGNCELWLGECQDVLPQLPPVNCVVTSPPYNTLAGVPTKGSGLWGQSSGGAGFVKALAENGYADQRPETEYIAEQCAVFSAINAAHDASLFYNHQIRWRDGIVSHPVEWFKPIGWSLRQEIIWDRCNGMMMNARMFVRFDERILWFTRGKWKWNQTQVGLGTVWRIPPQQNKDHPVAYPLEIPTRCISAATDPHDIVLDPYMGSATTGRKFIGIEREPKYFDVAVERIERAHAQGLLFDPYSKDEKSDSKNQIGLLADASNPLISLENLAEWTGLEPATPGVTGR